VGCSAYGVTAVSGGGGLRGAGVRRVTHTGVRCGRASSQHWTHTSCKADIPSSLTGPHSSAWGHRERDPPGVGLAARHFRQPCSPQPKDTGEASPPETPPVSETSHVGKRSADRPDAARDVMQTAESVQPPRPPRRPKLGENSHTRAPSSASLGPQGQPPSRSGLPKSGIDGGPLREVVRQAFARAAHQRGSRRWRESNAAKSTSSPGVIDRLGGSPCPEPPRPAALEERPRQPPNEQHKP
jgi:hypothetical protein